MHSNYTYSKCRRDYGKQCRFSKWGPKVLEDMKPDAELEKNWLLKNPINKETDCGVEWSEHDVRKRFDFFLRPNKIVWIVKIIATVSL